jgi:transposase
VNNNQTQEQFSAYLRGGQLVLGLNSEIILSETDPVRLASAQLEELDYRKLYEAYSTKGRKSAADAKVMFEIICYGYLRNIYSNRGLEDACRYRVDFMWLLGDETVPDQSTFYRFRERHEEAIEDLFYQYVNLLEAQGETDHEVCFIDGTKMESRAGRYTFVWRGTTEKNLQKVKDAVYEAVQITEKEAFKTHLQKLADGIEFVHGKGTRKSAEQREYEKLEKYLNRWEKYEEQLETMGSSRNSYSKTDPDATFMRMKDDHMGNGQLKPAYNVQISVNSEYITGIDAFSNRTDYGTLEPFLDTLAEKHGKKYAKVTADSGYESLDNYLYLEENGQVSFIKPQNYEQAKTKKYKAQIGRAENMQYDAEQDCYTCAEGRKLPLVRESLNKYSKRKSYISHYKCESCVGCQRRSECCSSKDIEKPKMLQIKKQLKVKRAESLKNITTEEGILLRMCRSIQVEGAFGLLKNDFGFRRFFSTGKQSIRTELFFLAMGFNLKKRWMKQTRNREKTHLSTVKTV